MLLQRSSDLDLVPWSTVPWPLPAAFPANAAVVELLLDRQKQNELFLVLTFPCAGPGTSQTCQMLEAPLQHLCKTWYQRPGPFPQQKTFYPINLEFKIVRVLRGLFLRVFFYLFICFALILSYLSSTEKQLPFLNRNLSTADGLGNSMERMGAVRAAEGV